MNRMKKILFFLDFPFNVGGSNKVLLTQAYIMKRKGYQVKVVISNSVNGEHAVEYDEICKEYKLAATTAYYHVHTCIESIDIMTALEDYEIIVKLIQEYQPDFIHSVQLNIAVELAARELRIPHLMNIYPVDEQAFNVNWMDAYPQYHSADTFLFSGRWGKGLGIPSRCIRVAYKIPSREQMLYELKKEDVIHIVSIGVLCKNKNQLEIIKFILQCRNNGQMVKLIILGKDDSDYGIMCKRFVEENGLQDSVIFKGFVLNVEHYLNEADLLILASMVESYPGVIVESMANRVPIISTAVGGIPELLKDEENAFLISGNNAGDIYEAFLKYLKYRNSGRIDSIIENAYSTYSEQHTYEAVGKQLECYYQWIVEDYHKKNESYLTVESIRHKFEKFVSENKIDGMERILKQNIWLFYHIFEMLEKKENRKVVIWGAGYWGSIAMTWISLLGKRVEFQGFIDTKKKGEYLGYPIVQEKDTVIAECGMLFVAVANRESILEIMDYLDERGQERNKDYFLICNSATNRY